MESRSVSNRVRKKLPDRWTRIWHQDTEDPSAIEIVPIADDIKVLEDDARSVSKWSKLKWTPLFFTNNFLSEYNNPKLDDFRLKERQLRRIGAEATSIRKHFEEAVLDLTGPLKSEDAEHWARLESSIKKIKKRA